MKPRLMRLFVVLVLLVAAFCWLGNWQWSVAHDNATRKVLDAANAQKRVPVDEVLKPGDSFRNDTSLRPISARGHFDAAHTEFVAGRVLHGKNGWWVMTPLVVDGSGARLPVVRGFVTSTSGVAQPPAGQVDVEGALAPGESQSQETDLPHGQIGTIDMGLLLNEWGGSVYNAFIFETAQKPAETVGATRVTPVPPPVRTKTSLNLQNAAYAVQWYVFALFAIFMWVKMVRDERDLERVHTNEAARMTRDDEDGRNQEGGQEQDHDKEPDVTAATSSEEQE